MSGHPCFQKNGLLVMSEQMIMYWVGRGSGCWGENPGMGREGNQTGAGQQDAWGLLGVLKTPLWVFEK